MTLQAHGGYELQLLVSFGLTGQGWLQLEELTLAFVLSALVGLEREIAVRQMARCHVRSFRQPHHSRRGQDRWRLSAARPPIRGTQHLREGAVDKVTIIPTDSGKFQQLIGVRVYDVECPKK